LRRYCQPWRKLDVRYIFGDVLAEIIPSTQPVIIGQYPSKTVLFPSPRPGFITAWQLGRRQKSVDAWHSTLFLQREHPFLTYSTAPKTGCTAATKPLKALLAYAHPGLVQLPFPGPGSLKVRVANQSQFASSPRKSPQACLSSCFSVLYIECGCR